MKTLSFFQKNSQSPQKFIFKTAHLLLLFILVACSTSPTGRKRFLLMPESQMNQMGTEAFNQLKQEIPIEKDPQVNSYIKCISLALAAEVDGVDPKDWEVVVFKENSANAFALPGGKIGVHTGMLEIAKTPDQLAAVIGHEIAHVTAQHSNERVSAQMPFAIAMQALGDPNNENHKLVMALLGVGVQVGVILPHGRKQESESDVMGLELMSKAGFDPRESVNLWKNMAAQGQSQPPEWLSTHPSHETRISQLQNNMTSALITYQKAQQSGKKPNCKL